ncbi:hypothetical protein FC57_GL001502 [Lactobacillus ultunensis DSM 16047]|nr:hypothetical protein FC57_GL001502 [Lactobacillus ultunensis DSM 16047]
MDAKIASKPFIGTVRNIGYYKKFENGNLPYSNACLEGFNCKIKQIERTAFY